MTTVLQVLKKARELIEKKGWTQGYSARNKEGLGVNYDSKRATCFCAIGAISRVCRPDKCLQEEAWNVLSSCVRNSNVVNWNDRKGRTKAQVLAGFDRAIAKAAKQAAKGER